MLCGIGLLNEIYFPGLITCKNSTGIFLDVKKEIRKKN